MIDFSRIPFKERDYPDWETVAQAREYVRVNLFDGGGHCPCCGQKTKIYDRKLHKGMARTIIAMYQAGAVSNFVHTPKLTGHEASQLAWWDLIESERSRRPDGGKTGFWRLTNYGIAYVERLQTITKYARVYDSQPLDFVGEQVDIVDALGDPFHYGELMGE